MRTSTNKTRSISVSNPTWQAAQELANSNTDGNISRLFEQFITFATFTPSKFSLNPPSPTKVSKNAGQTISQSMQELIDQMAEQPGETDQGETGQAAPVAEAVPA